MELAGQDRPKIGLALGSGAALGLSHIGVLKALKEAKIPLDMIAGTSIGAVIGAFFAKEGDIKTVEEVVLNINMRRLVRLLDPRRGQMRKGLIYGERIEKLLHSMLGDIEFSDLKIRFAAVATDINTGEEIILKEGPVFKALRASFSIPGIFVPVMLQGRCLVDGGSTNPMPTDILHDMGAEIIIAVNALHEPLKKRVRSSSVGVEVTQPPNIFATLYQSIYIKEHIIIKLRTPRADIVISPDVSHIGVFEFHRGKEAIAAGYEAANSSMSRLLELINRQSDLKK